MVMMMRGLGRGLGEALGAFAPTTKAGGGAAVEPEQTQWSPEYGGGRGLVQHDSRQIRNEMLRVMNDGRPWPLTQEQAQANAIAFRETRAAISTDLPPCPPQYENTMCGQSVGGVSTTITTDGMGHVGLLMPMTFERYGVAFGAHEIKDGKFQRVYAPSPAQRRLAEHAVIIGSWARIFSVSEKTARNDIGRNAYTSIDTIYNGQKATIKNPSVKNLIDGNRGAVLFLNNFYRNPIQPTPDEYNNSGGLQKWLLRGGYPLSIDVAQGKAPVWKDGYDELNFCASILCKCSTGLPACLPGKWDLFDGGRFRHYIAIPQDPGNHNFELALVHQRPSDFEAAARKVGDVGEWLMKKLAAIFCGTKDFAVPQMQQALAEQCFESVTAEDMGYPGDVNQLPICPSTTPDGQWCRNYVGGTPQLVTTSGKKCTKGAANCKCTAPPDATKASIAVANYAASKWCDGWAGDQRLPLPPPEPTPTHDPCPGGTLWDGTACVPEAWRPKWWMIALGGLSLGAIAFSFQQPRR